jgi:pilus assembly protein Flp/PilA
MFNTFKAFARDESGVTMIEYGLIAALVSVAAIAALVTLGGDLTGIFGHVSSCLQAATTTTPTC